MSEEFQPFMTSQRHLGQAWTWRVASCILLSWAVVMTILYATEISASDSSDDTSNVYNLSDKTLQIISYNDVYSLTPLQQGDYELGGAARVQTMINQLRQHNSKSITLLAGDTISPSLWSTIFEGEQMISGHNLIGLDYACFGNHEFDFGMDVLRERIAESEFVWLNSNVYDLQTDELLEGTVPWVVRSDLVPGHNVGFLGLLYQFGDNSTVGAYVEDPISAAARVAEELVSAGADFIIAVTHMPMSTDCSLVQNVADVDVVIGGHEHDYYSSRECGDLISLASSDWRDVTVVNVDFGASPPVYEIENVLVTSAFEEDPAMASLVEYYASNLDDELEVVIGETLVEIDVRTNFVRSQEAPIANFACDALIAEFQDVQANVSVMSGGSFRGDSVYPPGDLSRSMILTVFPFSNTAVVVELTAAELRATLESEYLARLPTPTSGFPQIGGFRIVFDESQPVGSRITGFSWPDGSPILDSTIIRCVVSDYEYYTHYTSYDVIVSDEETMLISVYLENAVTDNSPIAPAVDGRVSSISS